MPTETIDPNDLVSYIPSLRAFGFRLSGNHAETDDLVQDTLLKAIQRIDKFTPGTNLKAWLFTIEKNTFFNNRKRLSSRQISIEDRDLEWMLTVEAEQEWCLFSRDVAEVMSDLPEFMSEILTIVGARGERYEDAATICACEMGTVKSRLSRARAALLQGLGATSSNELFAH